jgi:L-aspartate oxidase
VRGEGGLLKNKQGVRFMEGTHELAELAPRDIVARAVVRSSSAAARTTSLWTSRPSPRNF